MGSYKTRFASGILACCGLYLCTMDYRLSFMAYTVVLMLAYKEFKVIYMEICRKQLGNEEENYLVGVSSSIVPYLFMLLPSSFAFLEVEKGPGSLCMGLVLAMVLVFSYRVFQFSKYAKSIPRSKITSTSEE